MTGDRARPWPPVALFLLLAVVVAPETVFVAPETASRPTIRQGYASRYDPGVFEYVVAHRFEQGWWRNAPPANWQSVAGFAATTDCNQVGQVVLMRPTGSFRWERVLVADCAGDLETLEWMVYNNIVAELDYGLFTRWASRHGIPLTIEMRPEGAKDMPKRVPVL